MNLIKKNSDTIYIKDCKIKKSQIATQTQKMRNEINQKIRDLGPKYYQIKNIFDLFSFHKDVLFSIGKDLEKEYKNIKKDILFQNKNYRMKESIVCWYVQNFYNELLESNSTILNRIIRAQKEYQLYNINISNLKLKMNESMPISKKKQNNAEIHIDNSKIQNDIMNKNNFFKGMIANTEIDSFDISYNYNTNF